MNSSKSEEKRDFVRSSVCLRAKARLLTADQYQRLQTARKTFVPPAAELRQIEPEQRWNQAFDLLNNMALQIAQLDEKLDRLLDAMERGAAGSPTVEIVETRDISGSGASLKMTGDFEIGQLLQISLELPGFPLGLFNVCGQVVRIEPCAEGDRYRIIGIQFLDIDENSREKLISCAFSQQRELIRQTKQGSSGPVG